MARRFGNEDLSEFDKNLFRKFVASLLTYNRIKIMKLKLKIVDRQILVIYTEIENNEYSQKIIVRTALSGDIFYRNPRLQNSKFIRNIK